MKKPTTRKEMLEAWQQAFGAWVSFAEMDINDFFDKLEAMRQIHLPVAQAKGWEDWTQALTALELHGLAPWGEVLPRLEEFVAWAEAHEDDVEPWLLAYGLLRVAYAKGNILDIDHAEAICRQLIMRYARHRDSALLTICASALFNAFYHAHEAGDPRKAAQLLDELRILANTHDEPMVRTMLSAALFNAFNNALTNDDPGNATQLLNELRALAKAHDEQHMQTELARALNNGVCFAHETGYPKSAAFLLDELSELAKVHDEPEVSTWLASALLNHGIWSGDTDEAYDAFSKALELVQSNLGDDARDIAAKARLNRNRLTCPKAKAANKKAS